MREPCRQPFAHDPDSCDCRPSRLDIQIDRFAASAEMRGIISKRDAPYAALIWLVAFIAALGFLYAAKTGLARTEHEFQLSKRV